MWIKNHTSSVYHTQHNMNGVPQLNAFKWFKRSKQVITQHAKYSLQRGSDKEIIGSVNKLDINMGVVDIVQVNNLIGRRL